MSQRFARCMAVFCLLMVPAHLALFGGAGQPVVAAVFVVLDVVAMVLWRVIASRRAANSPSIERTSS